MANVDAFNSGFDIGAGKTGKKKADTGDNAQQKPGGLSGLIQKGVQKLRKKGGGSAGADKGADSPNLPQNKITAESFKLPSSAVQGSFKHGGRVKKTGLYKLHKGEDVIPAKQRSSKKTSSRKRVTIKA